MELLIDDWITSHRTELLGFLSTLVQTPSEVYPPQGGELNCQRVVESAYRAAGATTVDVFTPDEAPGLRAHPAFFGTWNGLLRTFENRPNVVGVFKGSGGGRSLLLSAHVDTVPRTPLPWREAEPFSGALKDGKLYGRGSWDTKCGLAIGLYALKCVRAVGLALRGNVILESVVDEEYAGAHGTLASRLRGHNADIAINAEPTGMVVAPAHRGGGQWRITVTGQAGMAFANEKLSTPVYKLARVIEAVRAFNTERNAKLLSGSPPRHYESNPALPLYTLQVSGGGQSYAEAAGIPTACELLAWIEEHPGTTQAMHAQNFTSFIDEYLARDPGFDGIYPDYQPTIRYLPGSVMDQHPFFDVLEQAYRNSGQDYQVGGAPFACDTFIFNLHSPTPALTLGPRGGNAHAADEFVLIEDVLNLTRIYARAIAAWCG